MRILIAANHAVVRAGYRQFLESGTVASDIGEIKCTVKGFHAIRDEHWHLVLLDLCWPVCTGLDLLAHLSNMPRGPRILVISDLPERQFAPQILKLGATGFLSKGSGRSELLRAVQRVLTGERYASSSLAEHLTGACDTKTRPIHERLSSREFLIFCKLAAGGNIGQIARDLRWSPRAVAGHRKNILAKMCFIADADLTIYAMRHGLIG